MIEMVLREILKPQLLLGTEPIRAVFPYPKTFPAHDPSCRLLFLAGNTLGLPGPMTELHETPKFR